MILKGKRVLIAGMSDRRSIGFSIAQEAQKAGAEILLTSFGRMMSITQMTAKKLDPVPEILEMDVTKPSDIANAFKETSRRWDRIDGLLFPAIPFAGACVDERHAAKRAHRLEIEGAGVVRLASCEIPRGEDLDLILYG